MELTIQSEQHAEAIDVTARINHLLEDQSVSGDGIHIWIPHTTAGITVNESADPAVMDDLIEKLDTLVPWEDGYDHIEDNAAAHIKSILLGSNQWVPVSNGSLDLGRWQGIFLLEWDGPRTRTVQLRGV